jgi:hypothetical protein
MAAYSKVNGGGESLQKNVQQICRTEKLSANRFADHSELNDYSHPVSSNKREDD